MMIVRVIRRAADAAIITAWSGKGAPLTSGPCNLDAELESGACHEVEDALESPG